MSLDDEAENGGKQPMTWNRRVLRHKDGDDFFYQIHEVHYNKKGEIIAYTKNAVSAGGESLKVLAEELADMAIVAGLASCRNEQSKVLNAWELPKAEKNTLLKNTELEMKELHEVVQELINAVDELNQTNRGDSFAMISSYQKSFLAVERAQEVMKMFKNGEQNES